jgi:hypothetical protein
MHSLCDFFATLATMPTLETQLYCATTATGYSSLGAAQPWQPVGLELVKTQPIDIARLFVTAKSTASMKSLSYRLSPTGCWPKGGTTTRGT